VKRWDWIFTQSAARRAVRFIWPSWTRRSLPRSPPESDEEKVAEDKKPAETPKPDTPPRRAPPEAAKPKPAADVKDIKIDLDGIDQRILSVPMPTPAVRDAAGRERRERCWRSSPRQPEMAPAALPA